MPYSGTLNTMKIELQSLDGLPEALAPLVAQDGETHTLDLSQLVPATELDAFKSKAVTAQNEAIERRKALDAWKKLGDSPDAVAQKLANGADPKIIEQLRAQQAETEATYRQKLSSLMGAQATASLKAELAKVGVIPEAIDMLATASASRIRFDDDGNMQIMAPDGQTPMIGQGANGGATLADLAAKLAEAAPFAVADKGAAGGGKPSNSNGGTPGQKTVSRATFDAMSQAERAKFSTSGGKVVD